VNDDDKALLDQKVLFWVMVHGPLGMVTLENKPPPGLTSTEARQSAQRMVSTGVLYIDNDLKLAVRYDE